MNKTLRKILLILAGVIVLPIIFLITNEITSLSENESIINQIYSDQLDAILFSVNQYSEDIISSWASQTELLLNNSVNAETSNQQKSVEDFFNVHNSIRLIFISDSINDEQIKFFSSGNNGNVFNDSLNLRAKKILLKNDALINRLYSYRQEGFRKIEPVADRRIQDGNLLLFVSEADNSKKIYGLIINPRQFIQKNLSPKIQQIAGNDFVISVYDSSKSFQFNSHKEIDLPKIQQEKSLWIFPDYKLGILLIGTTIEDLVNQRTTTNLILISLLTLVLIVGVWFVFRNIKKEVELAEVKSDFVSNVSHELRTPLSLISMFSETLEMDRIKSEEKKKEYYSIISQEANRLGKIVNSILNFSKMEAGKRHFNFVDSYLNDVAENVYRSYKFHLEQKGFSFKIVKDETIPIIKIDEEAVSEAIVNLLDNAVKYSDNKKEITVSTGIENNFAFVEVEDKGIGIPDKDQKKVFEKFFRVSSGLVHTTKGTGLGLTLVKHIMDAHKGKIELFSEVGKGSKFRLLFPLSNS
jgi:two-component system phosphate regulon sensor histidine kinase PhoR